MADFLNIKGLEVDLERTTETSESITIGVKRQPTGRGGRGRSF